MNASAESNFNLQRVIEDLFMVLSAKEKEVIIKRFSLDSESRWTLERIGKKFGVTRERIRQIEKIALSKLRRTASNTNLSKIGDFALTTLNKKGGVTTQEELVNTILQEIKSTTESDKHGIILTLAIHSDLQKVTKSDTFHPYYLLASRSKKEVENVIKKAVSILKKQGDIVGEGKLISDLTLALNSENFSSDFVKSALTTSKDLKKIDGSYGLMTWRHVNPKSIRDKAYIVLKKEQKPLHFNDIASKISESKFDHKSVTNQAVHNELIRYEQFVLVGRGLYALKEWGYKRGTVSDIIQDLLAKSKTPLTKQQITTGVLKQRHVKKGTISLNLQKNPEFVRVGRALYALDLSKKAA